MLFASICPRRRSNLWTIPSQPHPWFLFHRLLHHRQPYRLRLMVHRSVIFPLLWLVDFRHSLMAMVRVRVREDRWFNYEYNESHLLQQVRKKIIWAKILVRPRQFQGNHRRPAVHHYKPRDSTFASKLFRLDQFYLLIHWGKRNQLSKHSLLGQFLMTLIIGLFGLFCFSSVWRDLELFIDLDHLASQLTPNQRRVNNFQLVAESSIARYRHIFTQDELNGHME